MSQSLTRKQFLTGTAGLASAAIIGRARAAGPIVIKCGTDLPVDHPISVHLQTAAEEIKVATNGAVTLSQFPNSQLGNDTHMLSNMRAGAMQMMGIGDNILADLVPSAAINNVGFAFPDAQTAWKAIDGKLGALVRPEIEKAGLHVTDKIWDMGFRETTTGTKPINTPNDLKGFKIRVPPSEMNLSIFKDLGASPVTLNVAELYTALQTKVVDGQETPLAVIETSRYYQVQKYCSLTNHMWFGYWMAFNSPFWKSIPANYQTVISDALDKAADAQRTANAAMNSSIQGKLASQGLIFNAPDTALFQKALREAGYYKEWKEKFGPALWSALEIYSGPLG